MTHRDTIQAFLDQASGPICDDCLSSRTQIIPRQTVNLNCRRMAKANQLRRIDDDVCYYCGNARRCNSRPGGGPVVAAKPKPITGAFDPHKLWHWEGNVQAALVAWLGAKGWSIRSAADTAAKSAGKDIVAERDGGTLWVSVKGYPSGTAKTNPSTQARHWFGHAVFDVVRYRDENDKALLAIALPDRFVTYRNLADRVQWLRGNLPFTIFWVAESGDVCVDDSR